MFSIKSSVSFSACDADQKLTAGGLVDYMQDCCNLQACSDNIDVSYLVSIKKAWILNCWHIVVKRMPQAYENITVFTWPYEFKGFYGMRNFKIEDETGSICAYADSTWTLVDIDTGRPAKLTDEVLEHYHIEEPYPMAHEGRKIAVKDEGELCSVIEVKKHHIDVNHHMNNAQYIREAFDYVPDDFAYTDIRAEYRKQTLLLEKLEIYRTITSESVTIVMKGVDKAVHAVIKFDKKDEEQI